MLKFSRLKHIFGLPLILVAHKTKTATTDVLGKFRPTCTPRNQRAELG
jgi:hypothetical protein